MKDLYLLMMILPYIKLSYPRFRLFSEDLSHFLKLSGILDGLLSYYKNNKTKFNDIIKKVINCYLQNEENHNKIFTFIEKNKKQEKYVEFYYDQKNKIFFNKDTKENLVQYLQNMMNNHMKKIDDLPKKLRQKYLYQPMVNSLAQVPIIIGIGIAFDIFIVCGLGFILEPLTYFIPDKIFIIGLVVLMFIPIVISIMGAGTLLISTLIEPCGFVVNKYDINVERENIQLNSIIESISIQKYYDADASKSI